MRQLKRPDSMMSQCLRRMSAHWPRDSLVFPALRELLRTAGDLREGSHTSRDLNGASLFAGWICHSGALRDSQGCRDSPWLLKYPKTATFGIFLHQRGSAAFGFGLMAACKNAWLTLLVL